MSDQSPFTMPIAEDGSILQREPVAPSICDITEILGVSEDAAQKLFNDQSHRGEILSPVALAYYVRIQAENISNPDKVKEVFNTVDELQGVFLPQEIQDSVTTAKGWDQLFGLINSVYGAKRERASLLALLTHIQKKLPVLKQQKFDDLYDSLYKTGGYLYNIYKGKYGTQHTQGL